MRPFDSGDPAHIGAYRLLGRLGEDSMGPVYLGRSEGGRTVTLKVAHHNFAQLPDFRRRFAQDVAAARRVGGPWTAAVLDADTDAAVPWVATQYVPGPDLHTVVSADFGPLPEHSVRVLANRLALALQAVHGAGLIHGDLKPTTVLVTADGPRVIDFGMAASRVSLAVGSSGFISPEQARGRELTFASDVFSLGSVLAYAATGRLPFGADGNGGPTAHLFRIVEDEPDVTGVPASLVDLVRACLEKDPLRRPTPSEIAERTASTSAEPWMPGAVLQQLARHSAQLLDLDYGPPAVGGAPVRPRSPQRRTRTLIAGTVAVAVIAVGGLVAFKPWEGNSEDKQGGGSSEPKLPDGVSIPGGFHGTWEGQLNEKDNSLAVKRLIRIQIHPNAKTVFVWTVEAGQFCAVENAALEVTEQLNSSDPSLTLSPPQVRQGKPQSKNGCAQQPSGKLLFSSDDALYWEFDEQKTLLVKKPAMTEQNVPDIFMGHRIVKREDRGFSSDNLLQLKTVTIEPGTVLASTVSVYVLAGKPGEAVQCYYQGKVFTADKDLAFTTPLESGSEPGATPACPDSLPAQMYSAALDGSFIQVSSIDRQGVRGTVERG